MSAESKNVVCMVLAVNFCSDTGMNSKVAQRVGFLAKVLRRKG